MGNQLTRQIIQPFTLGSCTPRRDSTALKIRTTSALILNTEAGSNRRSMRSSMQDQEALLSRETTIRLRWG
jgi:hypothetical protein